MNKKGIYAVFGAGGYGREVMPLARDQLIKNDVPINNLFFVVDSPEIDFINGIKVISTEQFLSMNCAEKNITYAIADSRIREEKSEFFRNSSANDWTVLAQNCLIMDDVKIGSGSIISPFVTLTSNISIGMNFHANIYSYVAHDCIVGDFVTLAPGVKCNGNVVIGSHAYIGTGAVIRNGSNKDPLVIGKYAVVGMGAVVTKSVPDGVTVIGNPAKIK